MDDCLDFSDALKRLRRGETAQRAGWNGVKTSREAGANMWIKIQWTDANSKMSLPYIYMKTADDDLVPWLASQTDLLANDWRIIGSHEGEPA